MSLTTGLPVERFLQTLEIVAREGKHLSYSWNSLFSQTIDAEWVRNLEQAPEIAERLEAFYPGLAACNRRSAHPARVLKQCRCRHCAQREASRMPTGSSSLDRRALPARDDASVESL